MIPNIQQIIFALWIIRELNISSWMLPYWKWYIKRRLTIIKYFKFFLFSNYSAELSLTSESFKNKKTKGNCLEQNKSNLN